MFGSFHWILTFSIINHLKELLFPCMNECWLQKKSSKLAYNNASINAVRALFTFPDPEITLQVRFMPLQELLRRAGVPPTKKRTVAKVSPKLLPAAAELIQSSPSFPRKSEGFDGVTVYHRSKRRPAAAAAADDEVYDQD